MSWSPLTSFCGSVQSVTNTAFLLSLPDLPASSFSRYDIYKAACNELDELLDQGSIDGVFYGHLCTHLDHAFSQGGSHA